MRMIHITVLLPEPYIEKIEEFVFRKLYPNRSEFIRTAIRDLIKEEIRQIRESDLDDPKKVKMVTLVDPINQKQYRIIERLE